MIKKTVFKMNNRKYPHAGVIQMCGLTSLHVRESHVTRCVNLNTGEGLGECEEWGLNMD